MSLTWWPRAVPLLPAVIWAMSPSSLGLYFRKNVLSTYNVCDWCWVRYISEPNRPHSCALVPLTCISHPTTGRKVSVEVGRECLESQRQESPTPLASLGYSAWTQDSFWLRPELQFTLVFLPPRAGVQEINTAAYRTDRLLKVYFVQGWTFFKTPPLPSFPPSSDFCLLASECARLIY